ncbi:MAG: ankyrin repeat domain-containing protein [Clostridiales bacterium]|jgi:ankyrin repeat protein|nr:ankyrin repeat domain-containing protein [Clostridiales bacterium]
MVEKMDSQIHEVRIEDVFTAYARYFDDACALENIDRLGAYGSLSHIAARAGDAHYIEVLALNGADINIADADGYAPLHDAVFYRHKKVTETLLQHGADAARLNMFGETALDIAITAAKKRKDKKLKDIVSLLERAK